MTPNKNNLNKLIKHFETFVLSRMNEIPLDFDNPESITDDVLTYCGYREIPLSEISNNDDLNCDEANSDSEPLPFTIFINDNSTGYPLIISKEIIEAALTEFNENIRMPMSQDIKIKYLKEIQGEFENLEANIIEKDSICISKNAICTNFTIDSLDDKLKEIINEYFYRLKQELRNVVALIHKKILEYNIEFDGDSISLPFKRIRIKAEINLIATLFYDLLNEKYIDTSKENLERCILACFLDNNRQPLKKSTIHTYLKLDREDKRSSIDKRIHVPPR